MEANSPDTTVQNAGKHHWVQEELVIVPLEARTAAEAISQLGARMQAMGIVKPSWTQAAIEREKTFATGLPTPEVGVAIPHTDVEHVIQQGIAVGVLREPVAFGEMGNPDNTVPVKIVCALAVAQSDLLVTLLQQLVEMFQKPGVLTAIANARTPSEIVELFEHHIQI